MQQRSGRYDGIVSLNRIEFVKAHDPYRMFQALLRLGCHRCRAICRIHRKTAFRHIGGICTAATAQFQYRPGRRQPIKKGRNMARYITRMIVDIVIGRLLIKSQRPGIKSVHIVGTGTSPE